MGREGGGVGRETWNWKIWPDYVAGFAVRPIGWKKVGGELV